ncbi:SCO family protein, partial [Pontibacter rugosus]
FISVFGTHHFSLKTFYPKLDEQGQVIYNSAGDTVFHTVPYFEMLSQERDTISQAVLDGDIYLIHFFDPTCGAPCQNIFSKLVRVQEAYENNPQVKLVSVSRTSMVDSLTVLQKLAHNYSIVPGTWYWLTGSTEETNNLNAAIFPEFAKNNPAILNMNDQLVLVDKEKKIRGVYKGDSIKEMDRVILEINVLLDEYSKRK